MLPDSFMTWYRLRVVKSYELPQKAYARLWYIDIFTFIVFLVALDYLISGAIHVSFGTNYDTAALSNLASYVHITGTSLYSNLHSINLNYIHEQCVANHTVSELNHTGNVTSPSYDQESNHSIFSFSPGYTLQNIWCAFLVYVSIDGIELIKDSRVEIGGVLGGNYGKWLAVNFFSKEEKEKFYKSSNINPDWTLYQLPPIPAVTVLDLVKTAVYRHQENREIGENIIRIQGIVEPNSIKGEQSKNGYLSYSFNLILQKEESSDYLSKVFKIKISNVTKDTYSSYLYDGAHVHVTGILPENKDLIKSILAHNILPVNLDSKKDVTRKKIDICCF